LSIVCILLLLNVMDPRNFGYRRSVNRKKEWSKHGAWLGLGLGCVVHMDAQTAVRSTGAGTGSGSVH